MKYKWLKPTKKMHTHTAETSNGEFEVGCPIIYFCKLDSDGHIEEFGYVDEIYSQLGGNVVILEGFDGGIKNVFQVIPYYWRKCRFYSSLYEMVHDAA